jgi:Predicted S-adenosylmethionine-dependent methyltransferase
MKRSAHRMKETLNRQQRHWERTFETNPDLFGIEPSRSAQRAADLFNKEGKTIVLELGSGQGRDTLFFAQKGFQITSVDYCTVGITAISEKAKRLGLSQWIVPLCHDIRTPLPFTDESFEACYAHMVFCMALTTPELEFLAQEVHRVLKPGGLVVYTVRHTGDAHYEKGIHRGEDMFEVGGFIVHFFRKEKVEKLAKGFEIMAMDEIEEGELPRKLFQVTLRKIRQTDTRGE